MKEERTQHIRESLQIRYSARLKKARLKERITELSHVSGLSASHIIGSLLLSGLEAAEKDPRKLIVKASATPESSNNKLHVGKEVVQEL